MAKKSIESPNYQGMLAFQYDLRSELGKKTLQIKADGQVIRQTDENVVRVMDWKR